MEKKVNTKQKKHRGDKLWHILLLALYCCVLMGCGLGEENNIQIETEEGRNSDNTEEISEYIDLLSETEPLYDIGNVVMESDGKFRAPRSLGVQFYKGEPVQLWALQDRESGSVDIYLYRQDGSRDLLYDHMSEDSFFGQGYLDEERNYYHWQNDPKRGVLTKTDQEGELVLSRTMSSLDARSLGDFVQLADGRLFVIYLEDSTGKYLLGELNPDTGDISKLDKALVEGGGGDISIGAGEDGGLYYTNGLGFWELNTEDGSRKEALLFQGTTYHWNLAVDEGIRDFRMLADGGVELLRMGSGNNFGTGGCFEVLRRVKVGEGKEVITMRGEIFPNWISEWTGMFNKSSNDYYVVLEECGVYGDAEEYARQTSIEIAAGKGPDLLFGDVLGEYTNGVAQKGGFVELTPYLKEMLIREEYFPSAFVKDGDRIVGIALYLRMRGYHMDREILGETADLKGLVESLLAWEGSGVYYDAVEADPYGYQEAVKAGRQETLRALLECSESLGGAVDWQAGTCDFRSGLFPQALEAARRYGYDGKNPYPAMARKELYQTYYFLDNTLLESEGRAMVAGLFDDGCYAIASGGVVSMNVNSGKKEGAWEYIRFLLGEEAQMAVDSRGGGRRTYIDYPVSRKVFDMMMEQEQALGRERQQGNHRWTEGLYDLTDERVDELKETLENARFLPTRTEEILDIVCEEAEDYFTDVKGMDEVIGVIQNRVQLYMDEIVD